MVINWYVVYSETSQNEINLVHHNNDFQIAWIDKLIVEFVTIVKVKISMEAQTRK